jgi:hypothetical protein
MGRRTHRTRERTCKIDKDGGSETVKGREGK